MKSGEKLSLKDLEQRKKIIETELNQIHNKLDESVNNIKDSIISTVDPSDKIRKNPLKSVGIAFVTGLILGFPRIRGKTHTNSGNGVPRGPGVTSMIMDEFKRIAARRAVQYVMDAVDRGTAKTSEKVQQESEDK